MAAPLSGKRIAKNVTMSVMAQVVSVLVGFVLNLVVPKFIDEYDYSYWQTFLLYSQYLGILHFGLMDGIVLRYAQYDYEELDKKSVRSQYLGIMAVDFVLSLGLLIWSLSVLEGVNRVIGILLACTTCIEITYNYISFTFQITNRISRYVSYIAVYRVIYCVLVLSCLIAGSGSTTGSVLCIWRQIWR
jgi:O-antigen/teichoic acid export membrane protein